MKGAYNWGEWESGDVVQCGVHIHGEVKNNVRCFHLEQKKEALTVKGIYLKDKYLRREDQPLHTEEKNRILGVTGEGQWYGNHTLPTVLAKVAEVQSKVAHGTVGLIKDVNQLVKLTHETAGDGVRIFYHKEHVFFIWHDATWASRPDGSSEGGWILCVAGRSADLGHISNFSVLDWGAKKLRRVCRSSLASELQQASGSDGELHYARALYYELLHGGIGLEDTSKAVSTVPGVTVMDAKARFDCLDKNESSGLGLADRRSALEALALGEDMEKDNTVLRWAHSHAQLADALTKHTTAAFQMMRTFVTQGRWRLEHGDFFLSARKRRMVEDIAAEDRERVRSLEEEAKAKTHDPTGPSWLTEYMVGAHEIFSFPPASDCESNRVQSSMHRPHSRNVISSPNDVGCEVGEAGIHY